MRWTERQRAMLREMGVRLWLPEDAPARALAEMAPSPTSAKAPERDERRAATSARAATPAGAAAHAASQPPRTAPAADAPRIPGLAPADWLVVAEPLDPADAQQEQLLANMLRAIGVALVAPTRESRAVFCAVGDASAADPVAGRAAADAALARAALATAAPRCVLAFGRAAAAALLGADAPVGALRGRVHVHDGVPVVVTLPLAFLLRHPAEKAKAWADLCLAVRTLESEPDT